MERWSGVGSNRPNTHLKDLVINWEGEERNFNFAIDSFTLTTNNGGTWETDWYEFPNVNTDPIIILTASLTDLNNNRGFKEEVIIIETDTPTLTRISSTANDGSYGEYRDTYSDEPGSRFIDIFLDFNKPVEFFTSTDILSPSNAPRLILNNGGEAFYHTGNGSTRIIFRYFVNGIIGGFSTGEAGKGGISNVPEPPGNPEGRLNVIGIDWRGFAAEEWRSEVLVCRSCVCIPSYWTNVSRLSTVV
jgi:hypothetical protein